jgi:hypothetical protein
MEKKARVDMAMLIPKGSKFQNGFFGISGRLLCRQKHLWLFNFFE